MTRGRFRWIGCWHEEEVSSKVVPSRRAFSKKRSVLTVPIVVEGAWAWGVLLP